MVGFFICEPFGSSYTPSSFYIVNTRLLRYTTRALTPGCIPFYFYCRAEKHMCLLVIQLCCCQRFPAIFLIISCCDALYIRKPLLFVFLVCMHGVFLLFWLKHSQLIHEQCAPCGKVSSDGCGLALPPYSVTGFMGLQEIDGEVTEFLQIFYGIQGW